MKPNRLLNNISWILVCHIAQALISLAIGMVSARYLGPSDYGLINYASSLVAFVVPIVQLGIRHVLVEEIVSNPKEEGKTLGTAIAMSTGASLLGMIGVVAFAAIANRGEPETVIVCFLYSFSLIFQMTEMIKYWYQAKLMSKYTSIVSLGAYAVVAVYRVFLLITQKSVYWFAVSHALDFLIISVVLLVLYFRVGEQKLAFSTVKARHIFAKSKYYIISGMMVTVFSETDKIMLKAMVNEAEIGYYSAAMTCAGVAGFVFAAIIDSMRPVIFECKRDRSKSYEKNLIRLFSIVIYFGLLQGAGLTLLSNLVIQIAYGEAFSSSVTILRILAWNSLFVYLGTVRNIYMLAEEKQKYLWIVNLFGAVLNVVGNAVLIPVCGAIGASLATVATQCFANLIMCVIIKPIRPVTGMILQACNPRTIVELIRRKDNR